MFIAFNVVPKPQLRRSGIFKGFKVSGFGLKVAPKMQLRRSGMFIENPQTTYPRNFD